MRHHKFISALAILSTLAPLAAFAGTLGEEFRLPEFLGKRYGAENIRWVEDVSSGQAGRAERKAPTWLAPFRTQEWVIHVAPGLSATARAESGAEAFLNHVFAGEMRPDIAGDALFKLPADARSSQPILERATREGARLLMGQPSEDPQFNLWWKLKFENPGRAPEGPATKGEWVLAGIIHHKYVLDNVPFPAIVNFADPGHAALALMQLDGDPAGDLYLNTGSKDVEGNEVPLPVRPKPETVDMMRVSNFWDWLEVQTTQRYTRVQAHLMRINPLQLEALKLIAAQGDGMGWGHSKVHGNNCADSVAKIVQALLPAGEILEGYKSLLLPLGGWVSQPKKIVDSEAAHFPRLGVFDLDGSPLPRAIKVTPEINYLRDQKLGPIQERPSYRKYREWKTTREPKLHVRH